MGSAPAVTESDVAAATDKLLADHADDDDTTFLGAQFDAGLTRVDFPVGHGGLDAPPALQVAVDRALAAGGRAPTWGRNPMGIGMVAPTIVTWGTEEHRRRFLRPIFTAEEIWCQLFSEPGAGSDVASLATRARRDGDRWVLDGQKTWTSSAHAARFGLVLARTDPEAPKHRGLTMFVIDMHQSQVTVRPIRSIAGASGFNEVFLDGATTPDEWRVGPCGDGWKVATATLMNERVALAGDIAPRGSGLIAQAVAAWTEAGSPASSRDTLMRLWTEAEVQRLTSLRARALRERGVPGAEGSVLKLSGAVLSQRIASFTVAVLGPAGQLCAYDDHADEAHVLPMHDPAIALLSTQAATIAGGTTEVQKNVIGERVLGLPREPGLDPNTPWSEIPRS